MNKSPVLVSIQFRSHYSESSCLVNQLTVFNVRCQQHFNSCDLNGRMGGVRGHDPAWGHWEGHLCDLWINRWCHCALGCIQAALQSAVDLPPLWSVGQGCCDWADRPRWVSSLKGSLWDCRARPGPRWRRSRKTLKHCGQPPPKPFPTQPLLCLRALPPSVILPVNPIPDQRPRRKKGKRRERRQRSEKGERLTCMWRGREGRAQQTLLYLKGEAAAQTGAPVFLLLPRPTPSSTPLPASARPMKGCHGNTPGPQSEINNLSTSSEQSNL